MTARERARRYLEPGLIVAVAVGAQLEIWLGSFSSSKLVAAILTLAWTLPLLVWRRNPIVVALGLLAAVAVESIVAPRILNEQIFLFVPILSATLILGSLPSERQAIGGGLVGFCLTLPAVALANREYRDDPFGFDDVVFVTIVYVAPWTAGFLLRGHNQRAAELAERAELLEWEREERARIAAEEERQRIARELHDVIAHNVAVMTVQAGAARLLLRDEPERARAPIVAVEETGREALAEMRRMVGVLRRDLSEPALAPQPGLATLGRLLERVRSEGFEVELRVEGEAEALTPGLDLAAYRFVQDAIEIARARPGAARADVAIRWRAESLELEVVRDGSGDDQGSDEASRALAAVRERIRLYRGTVDVRPAEGGRWAIEARLPLRENE